ncbi:hypothetical protein GGF31_000733 [Allomyces arbusculus]|nr:hypothetical protein GGF31_000733 [Allomyces arbusculus]
MGGSGPSTAPVPGSVSSSDLPTASTDPPVPAGAPPADPHARAPSSRLGAAGANLRQFFAHRAHGNGPGSGPSGRMRAAHHVNTDDSDTGELLDFLDDGGDEAGEFFLLGGDLSADDNDDAPDPAAGDHDDSGGARMPGPASHTSSSDALAGPGAAPHGDPAGGAAAAGSAAHASAASAAGGRDSSGAATSGAAGLALASLWGYFDLPSLVSGDPTRLGGDGGASDGTSADGSTKNDANLNWLSPATYIGLLTYPPGGLALVRAMNGTGGGAPGKPVTKATFSTLRETALVRNRRRLLTMFTSYSLLIRYCSFDAFLLILLLSNCLILYYLKNARKINVQMAKRNIKQRVGWAKQWAGGLFRRGNPNGGGARNDGPDGAVHDEGIEPGGVGPGGEHSGDSNDMPLVPAPNSTEKKKRRGIPFRRPTISGTTSLGGGSGTAATTNGTLPTATPALGVLVTTTPGVAPTTSSGPASPAPVPPNKQGTTRRINLFRRAASVEAGPDLSNPFAAVADAHSGSGSKDNPAPLIGSGSLGSVAIGAASPSGSTLLDLEPPPGGTTHSASSSTSSSTGSGSTLRLAKKTTGFLFPRRRANSGNPRDLLGTLATVAAAGTAALPSASSGVDDGGPETTSDESWVSDSPNPSPTHAIVPPLVPPPHPVAPARVLPPAQSLPPLTLEHGARGDETTVTFAAPPRSPTAVNVTQMATTVPAVVTTESRPPARAGSDDALPDLVAGLDAVLASLPSPNTPPSEPVTALPPPQELHARATTAPAGTRSGSDATIVAAAPGPLVFDSPPALLPQSQSLHPPDLPLHPGSAPTAIMTRRASAPRTTPTHSRQPSDGTGAGASSTGASAAALRSLATGPRMSAVVGKAKDLWGHVKEKTATPPPPVPPPSGYHDQLSQHRARGLPESPSAAAERVGASAEGHGVGPVGNGAGVAGGTTVPGEGAELHGGVPVAGDGAGADAVAS